jgi:formate dehydrogenase subunit delta
MSSYDGKLVMMANQIAKFYLPQKQVEPVAAIAAHIRKFWDPRMRAAIIALVEKGEIDQGGTGLDEPARQAVERLKQGARPA